MMACYHTPFPGFFLIAHWWTWAVAGSDVTSAALASAHGVPQPSPFLFVTSRVLTSNVLGDLGGSQEDPTAHNLTMWTKSGILLGLDILNAPIQSI